MDFRMFSKIEVMDTTTPRPRHRAFAGSKKEPLSTTVSDNVFTIIAVYPVLVSNRGSSCWIRCRVWLLNLQTRT